MKTRLNEMAIQRIYTDVADISDVDYTLAKELFVRVLNEGIKNDGVPKDKELFLISLLKKYQLLANEPMFKLPNIKNLTAAVYLCIHSNPQINLLNKNKKLSTTLGKMTDLEQPCLCKDLQTPPLFLVALSGMYIVWLYPLFCFIRDYSTLNQYLDGNGKYSGFSLLDMIIRFKFNTYETTDSLGTQCMMIEDLIKEGVSYNKEESPMVVFLKKLNNFDLRYRQLNQYLIKLFNLLNDYIGFTDNIKDELLVKYNQCCDQAGVYPNRHIR